MGVYRAMLVFVVAVWKLGPDWSSMLESATTLAPVSGESWGAYLFFVVVLIGAQMTPYEMFFFSSGAVESRWRPKDLIEMRVNVIIGFPLGGPRRRDPGGGVPRLLRARHPGRAHFSDGASSGRRARQARRPGSCA